MDALTRAGWCLLVAAAVLLAGAPRAADASQEAQALEQRVKAAFIYKFLGYVEWKSSKFEFADSPIVIGVIAAPDLEQELTQIVSDHRVAGRPIVVRSLSVGSSLEDVHAVFVGSAANRRLDDITAAAQERSVLVVTETPDGLDRGSVINLLLDEGHVRFEISLPAAESCDLRVSSRLLSVAKSVRMGARTAEP